MRIAMTGSKGRVGQYLIHKGVQPFLVDVTDPVDVDKEINRLRPDVILHLASKSDVNWCEREENEDAAIDVNYKGAATVFEMAEKHECRVVLLSSAHVFSGKRWWGKYKEGDRIAPSNMYGLTKASAEIYGSSFSNVSIVRTSYLFNYARLKSDIETLRSGEIPVQFPTFMKRSFLYIPHFSEMLMEYCRRINDMPSILHLSGCDTVSWYQFMLDISKTYNVDPRLVRPCRKDLKNGYANRGYRLGLDTGLSESLGFRQYSYKEGIDDMVHAFYPNDNLHE